MNGGRGRALIMLGAALVLLVATAWIATSLLAPKDAYEVRVLEGPNVIASYTLNELKALGMETIVVEGLDEEGPSLLRVLEAAGVTSYERLTIRGAGVRDDGEIILEAEDVTPDIILDIANRGTVKVVSPKMAWSDRVRDVTDIIVEGATQ